MEKEQINNAADNLKKELRAKKLQKKYSFKTNAERMKPFADLFIFSSWFFQLLSGLLAAGGVLLLTTKFSNNFAFICAGTILFLFLLESFKRLSYLEFNRQRNSGENVGKTILLFCLIAAFFSVSSSYLGASHTVSFFAASPSLIDTDLIKKSYNSKIEKNKKSWNVLREKSLKKAQKIHEKNNWMGVTVRAARTNEQTEINRAGSYMDSLLKFESLINLNKNENVKKANLENEKIIINHEIWAATFGDYLAIISIFFELSLFIILFWCSDFEKRELEELNLSNLNTKDKDKNLFKVTNQDKEKENSKNVFLETSGAILAKRKVGFIQDKETIKEDIKDGNIFIPKPPAKKPRICVQLLDGRLKNYTSGSLTNLINSSDLERAKQLKPYLIKLKKIENGNK